ncbi:MAG: hypothetical protein ABIK85_00940, partial [Candidatus Eisenbacteria bacterium]
HSSRNGDYHRRHLSRYDGGSRIGLPDSAALSAMNVLSELLKRHPDLCDEARSIAESLASKKGQEASGEDGGSASRRGRREQGLRSR